MNNYIYKPISINRLITVESIIMSLDVIRPKDFFFPGEMHDFWEAVLVCSGNVTATSDERIYHLSEGQLLFHKPFEFHRIWSTNDSQPHLIIISFKATGDGMNNFAERCFNIDALNKQKFTEICRLFEETCNSYKVNDKNFAFISSRTATVLEEFLLSLSIESKPMPSTSSPEEERYKKIVNIMEQYCCENLSVTQLSTLCNMSVSSMKRIFSKYSDRGVAKFFLSLKIRRAMQLLDEGKTACEVAKSVGFQEIPYFHTVFKRETGMTPTSYKKSKKY